MARIVVTGANRGIGLSLARTFAGRGDTVIAAVRKTSKALTELGVTIHEDVDVGSSESVERFAAALGDQMIDVVVNNAGILSRETLEDLDWDRIRRQFEINTLGPLRVVAALLPRLAEGSKIAIVSSRVGSMADNGSGGIYGYRISKAAVNMVGVDLAVDLKPRGIAVLLIHPGLVQTDMAGGPSAVAPDDAAARIVARIDALTLATTGQFLHAEGYELPW
ncbi:MAG: SDR family oxidoreductase [Hyphomicrobiales bacterium]|nr:SDR family oxidoreductase [Hyphomicrobiales bacterium]